MRIPYSVQGALFGPVLIGLTLILKVLCPASAGSACFADQLAVPIFFPLIMLYATTGDSLLLYHELWFVLFYWAFVGFLIGFILDLRERKMELK